MKKTLLILAALASLTIANYSAQAGQRLTLSQEISATNSMFTAIDWDKIVQEAGDDPEGYMAWLKAHDQIYLPAGTVIFVEDVNEMLGYVQIRVKGSATELYMAYHLFKARVE